jgi:hypothetical protein
MFPKFDAMTKEEGIRLYCQLYADESARLAAKWPDRVAVFASPDCFEEPRLTSDLLRFAGWERPRVLAAGQRHNCLVHCH